MAAGERRKCDCGGDNIVGYKLERIPAKRGRMTRQKFKKSGAKLGAKSCQ
jgi:hypothetical protein